jgi:hypothetical protein
MNKAIKIDKQQVTRFGLFYTKLHYKNNSGNLRERWAYLSTDGKAAFVVEGNTEGFFCIELEVTPADAVGLVNQT